MKIFLVILGLMFGSIQAQAEISDADYVKQFKRMWDGASKTKYGKCSVPLVSVEVDDVVKESGRWQTVTFNYTYSLSTFGGGRKHVTHRAYMRMTKTGSTFSAKYQCAVISSHDNKPMCYSENCKWLN